MIRYLWATAAIMLCVWTCTPASGGILSNGPLTRDTETGREWLDLSFTVGRTYFSVENDPTLGGQVSGFHAASAAELESLMNAVGVSLGLSLVPSAYTPVDTILTFVGRLFVDPFDRWSESFIVVTDAPPSQPDRRIGFQIRVDEPGIFPARGTTLQWPASFGVLGSGSTSSSILVRSAPNGTPATAIAPASADAVSGALSFVGTGAGAWFNAGGQAGPDLQIMTQDGSKITHVSLPKAAGPGLMFTVFDPQLGEVHVPFGEVHVLSEAVESLLLGGLPSSSAGASAAFGDEPFATSAALADPFPIFLQFDASTVNFVMTSIPAPNGVLLLAIGAAALGQRVRRRRSSCE